MEEGLKRDGECRDGDYRAENLTEAMPGAFGAENLTEAMPGAVGAENLTEAIAAVFGRGSHDAGSQTSLALAYIGDCVYELVIRTVLITHEGGKNGSLHNKAKKLINASAQAEIMDAIKDDLTEEETGVFHRGLNSTNNASRGKHSSIVAYRKATGLEALIGYLYLEGRHARLTELMKMGLERICTDDGSFASPGMKPEPKE